MSPQQKDPIIFFSSDATALYKGDIFRCLALPDGHTIQFRYAKQWMHEQIANAPHEIKNRLGLIVFVGGNDNPNIPSNQRRLKFEPVRLCTVKDAEFDYATEQVLVILELCQFAKCRFAVPQGPSTDIFVAPGKITDYQTTNWLECVRRLQSYYSKTLFFRLNNVLAGTEVVPPTYLDHFRVSRFNLFEETDYSLECLYYHPSGDGSLPLSMTCDSKRIEISNTFASGAGAALDKRFVHLRTGLLASPSERAFITFSSSTSEPPYDDPNHVQILWQIRRKPWKFWLFIGCVMLGGVGLGMVQIGTKLEAWSSASIILLLVGGGFVAAGAGLLYRYFNKT